MGTLGGHGTAMARTVVELHWSYGFFLVMYVSSVVFAVICIIQALFLKDTLDAAASDAEMMVQERLSSKKANCENSGRSSSQRTSRKMVSSHSRNLRLS